MNIMMYMLSKMCTTALYPDIHVHACTDTGNACKCVYRTRDTVLVGMQSRKVLLFIDALEDVWKLVIKDAAQRYFS